MDGNVRNFRSSYYGKVGCDSVEEKKSLNKLLQDNIRNHAKLKQFCLSYTVPTAQRSLLWKIIMGIMPLHKNSCEYVLETRKAVYDDLLRAVNVMQAVDSHSPKHKVLHTMWLLENNRLLHPNAGKGVSENDKVFVEIVKVIMQIFDDDVEIYWVAKEFYLFTKDIQQECPKLKDLTQTLLKREDIAVYTFLDKLDVFKYDILDNWYISCYAGIIIETALIKIWDKICGGSRKIVVFVFLELVKTLREAVMKCNNSDEFKSLIEQVKDPDAVIVNKAIKSWQGNKSHSEIEHLY